MMTSHGDVLDPMYNFDTHFPERLSHLHMHGDTFAPPSIQAPCLRKKKSRANRSGARYKTQPVTFDEITEVDETPASGEASEGKDGERTKKILGQLQAFSRSMDGLVPSHAMLPTHMVHHTGIQRSGSFTRSGSRKYHRHPECIPEKAEGEAKEQLKQQQEKQKLQQQATEAAETRLAVDRDADNTENNQTRAPLATSEDFDTPEDTPISATPTNVTGSAVTGRRQKMTAKAKKRQKAQEEGEGS